VWLPSSIARRRIGVEIDHEHRVVRGRADGDPRRPLIERVEDRRQILLPQLVRLRHREQRDTQINVG